MVNPGASTEALTWEPWVGSPHLNKACPLQAQLIVMSTQNLIIIRLLQICTIQTPTSEGLRAQSLTNMIRVSREWLVTCGHHLFSRVGKFPLSSCTYSSELIYWCSWQWLYPCFTSRKIPSRGFIGIRLFGVSKAIGTMVSPGTCWSFRNFCSQYNILSLGISFVCFRFFVSLHWLSSSLNASLWTEDVVISVGFLWFSFGWASNGVLEEDGEGVFGSCGYIFWFGTTL